MEDLNEMFKELSAAFGQADYVLQINKPAGTDANVELRSNMQSGVLMLWAVTTAITPIYDAALSELMKDNAVDVTGLTEMLAEMLKNRLELAALTVTSGKSTMRGWIKEG